jgi:hypothetical protein
MSPETPSSGKEEPSTDAQVEPEPQIDDIDTILKTIDKIQADEDDELEEAMIRNKGGRPKEGFKRGTDTHPLGRDPLGNKENKKAYKRSSLSLETKNFLDRLPEAMSKYKKIITETSLSDDKTNG